MKIESFSGTRRSICKSAGPFQRTFVTPRQQLPVFADVLLRLLSVESGYVFVDTVVFTPDHVDGVLAAHGLAVTNYVGSTIAAQGLGECRALLAAALGDDIDFFFVPDPRRFLLYADHDEYTTLFAHKKGQLAQLSEALIGEGVKEVPGFTREF